MEYYKSVCACLPADANVIIYTYVCQCFNVFYFNVFYNKLAKIYISREIDK